MAASTVLLSHSFAITQGTERNEPFVRLFGPGNIMGLYAVFTFFVISGFLITRSFVRRSSLAVYLTKRSLRIFPGLIVCSVLCAFVLGAALTTLPVGEYLRRMSVWRYVFDTVTLVHGTGGAALPGVVFDQANDYGALINGSTWSLGPEFLCYLVVAALGLARVLRWPVVVAILAFGLWTHTHALGSVGYVMAYFAAGAVLFFVHEWRRPGRAVVALSVLGLVAGAALGWPTESFALFGALLVIQLATTDRVNLGDATRFGDLSYGIYLYGWPMEQLMSRAMGHDAHWWAVFACALPLAALGAWLSWHLVEQPALSLAPRLRAWRHGWSERRAADGGLAEQLPVAGQPEGARADA